MQKILLLVILNFLTLCFLTAQESKTYQIIQKSEKGVPVFIRFNSNTDVSHENLFGKMKDEFGFQENDKFILEKTSKDNIGFIHYKYHQVYKGIPLFGAQFIIHEKNGLATSANGKFIPNLSIDIVPSISKDEAIKKAQLYLNFEKYSWQNEAMEKELKERTKDLKATYYPSPELVIAPVNGNYEKAEFRLCWKFSVSGIKLTDAFVVFIDAHAGKLIDKISQVHNSDVTGLLNTYYYGEQSMQVQNNSTPPFYVLGENETRGPTNTQIINNYDFRNYSDTDSGIAITNNTLSFDFDPISVGNHWAIEKSYDFFYSRYQRNSYDNLGAPINIWSHFNNKLNNAFWTETYKAMVFGDGDSSNTTSSPYQFGPWGSLDVAGHELYHAYTAHSSGLSLKGESGALNESFSDIMGAGVEYSVLGVQSGLWTFGEQSAVISNEYVRSLSNPKLKQHPNTYHGQYWISVNDTSKANDDGGVHYNCGVQNYWFYLLTEGGSGTVDDLGTNSYNITGIGIEDALAVAYYTNTNFLVGSATYNDAMNASVEVARQLFGETSSSVQSVKDAWCAVGLDCTTTGINETNNNLSISIYPNPANNMVTIQSDGKPTQVSLYDLTGRQVISTQMRGVKNNLDVSALSQGMYVIQFQESEKFYQTKFIKQ